MKSNNVFISIILKANHLDKTGVDLGSTFDSEDIQQDQKRGTFYGNDSKL